MDGYDRDEENELLLGWGGDDGDGTGRLTVIAAANGFSGTSRAWFNADAVIEFAEALRQYPLPDEPPTLSGGLGADDEFQELVGLAVGRVGLLGQVGVRAHLSTEIWPDTRSESHHDVRLELLTSYQRLGVFSRDLQDLVEGRSSEARLGGELLA